MTIYAHVSGRIGKDAELKYTQNGKAVVKFNIGHDEWDGKEKTTGWVSCSLWGDRAAKLVQHLTKGSAVTVHGRLRHRTYTTNEGETRVSTDMDANDIDLQGKASAGQPDPDTQEQEPAPAQQNRQRQASSPQAPQGAGTRQQAPQRPVPKPQTQQQAPFDDDIPF